MNDIEVSYKAVYVLTIVPTVRILRVAKGGGKDSVSGLFGDVLTEKSACVFPHGREIFVTNNTTFLLLLQFILLHKSSLFN